MKIISGGQTGVDRMALEVARKLGFPTGGTAPKDHWTENGPDPSLQAFGLLESDSRDYPVRTLQNILDAEGTIIYGNTNNGGSRLTFQLCRAHQALHIVNPRPEALASFIQENDIQILNVAGCRASKLTAQQLLAYQQKFEQGLNLLRSRQMSLIFQ